MTCHTDKDGNVLVSICDGHGDGWRVAREKPCQWCLEKRRCLYAYVFGGWCGTDWVCGTCGSEWTEEDYLYWKKVTEEQRDENVARVAAHPDPKCWDCHDTGDAGLPFHDDTTPCKCEAARVPKEGE